ncbi:hypothetical protein HPG69_004975 [Diceros bicornis minor]|uniref:Uncharacterized protein n=1 Tax=Diceros bicornis minor TaxID=77932 RepID=A0A7J7E5J5_DICBM|nr:hypothetical protein HPG69_004975 [Diceros bicornis minor]
MSLGVQGFQDYIEKYCPRSMVRGSLVGGRRQRPLHTELRLLLDANKCLHRLYGGFYTDWVRGGQWNHMLDYLATLAKACFCGNIELFIFFNGALEKTWLHEWVKRQGNQRQTAQQIVSHVQNKGTRPPEVWFLPPSARRAAPAWRSSASMSRLRRASRTIRENAQALELSRKGKSLTTSQYLMHEVAKQLDLNLNRFPLFAALLGNHTLPDEDLASFRPGPQLVLPPCSVVIKAVANYVRNVQDALDLDAVAKDVFQHSQSRTDDKTKSVWKSWDGATVRPPQMLSIPQTSLQAKPVTPQVHGPGTLSRGPHRYSLAEPALTLETSGKNLTEQNSYSNIPHEGKHTPLYERSSPINPAPSGSPNHVDWACFPASSTCRLQTMVKAAVELQTISVGTEWAGRRQEAPRSLKQGETQETKQRQKVGRTPHAQPGQRAHPSPGSVLRPTYPVQWPGARMLRRPELDAFLAQALSPKLYEPDQLQELKIENLHPRGIQLSAHFMSGSLHEWRGHGPVCKQHVRPATSGEKTPLIDLCDGQAEQAAKVEKMRQNTLEGLSFSRQSRASPSHRPRRCASTPPPCTRGAWGACPQLPAEGGASQESVALEAPRGKP